VVHISLGGSGGAHLAAYRLHQALQAHGVESRMLVGGGGDGHQLVDLPVRSPGVNRALRWLSWRAGVNDVLSPDALRAAHHPLVQAADIVHFHNLHSGYFNYLAIPRFCAGRGAVLTLHDMWSFTGHCAFSYGCERWRTGCGHCPLPGDHPSIGRDGTHLEWCLKDAVYGRSRLMVTAPSRWMADLARQSMLSRFPVHHVPYGLDVEAYSPRNTAACRAHLGLPAETPVVLCATADFKDRRKGPDVLVAAWRVLPSELKRRVTVVLMGQGGQAMARQLEGRVRALGFCESDHLKAVAMSAADLLVMPSRADNLPLVVMEMMACGRPVVASDVGGIGDLVEDGVTGRLVPADSPEALAQAVSDLCTAPRERARLGAAARARVMERFTNAAQAKRFLALYTQARGGDPVISPAGGMHLVARKKADGSHESRPRPSPRPGSGNDFVSLEALCRTPLRRPWEVHHPNQYYGLGAMLRQYAGWPWWIPLKAGIEHGLTFNTKFWWLDAETRLPLFLTMDARRSEDFTRQALHGAFGIAIGPYIHYAPLPEGAAPPPPGQRHLLVFPAHSTHHVSAHFDMKPWLARLEELRTEFTQVRICLYWRDVQHGAARLYRERDFECVSAGHLFDPAFMTRLRGLLHGCTHVFANDVGTHLLYALALGKPAWLERQSIVHHADVSRHRLDYVLDKPKLDHTLKALAEPQDAITPAHRTWLEEVGGLSCLRKPEELHAIFLEAEFRFWSSPSLRRLAVLPRSLRGTLKLGGTP
jgi:glycosyltransferase involved in cell wall biosynthesis